MLTDLRCRQFTASCQLIDGGLGHAKKPRHLHDGEDFPIASGIRFRLSRRFSRYITIHNE